MHLGPAVNGALGTVQEVSGSHAHLRLDRAGPGSDGAAVTVGELVGIVCSTSIVVGVATSVRRSPEGASGAAAWTVDLVGEIKTSARGERSYRRGVTHYPTLGQPAVRLNRDDLHLIFGCPGEDVIRIGDIHQDPDSSANLKVDDLLTKHFAVLGSTGVGKSSGVAVIMGEILKAKPELRVFFIDPHNEYGSCFEPEAEVLSPDNLRLPFWLFNFEEMVDVLFRGRPGLHEETDILAELIPVAKSSFAGSRVSADRSPLKRTEVRASGLTADTPVPYRLADLIAVVEERRGKLENRSLVANYTRLLSRIETLRTDPRYGFMFDAPNVGADSMLEVVGQLFRIPANGKRMTVIQLAGFPGEVVDSVVSVLCRMAFELGLWSDGNVPMLLVCEEAHRYAPADRAAGFGPTRKALSRIAKEGRKYGVYLGLVTQRPAELDATIISQCSTVLAMRMANDRDQAILRAAVSDAGASLINFVPSLGTREAFGFGEAMPLPTRIRFKELPPDRIPRSQAVRSQAFKPGELDGRYMASIIERWRGGNPGQAHSDGAALSRAPAAAPALPQAGEAFPERRTALNQLVSLGPEPPRFGVRR